MKDTKNIHLKVQELCDCFSTTDPLKEMSEVKDDENSLDGALKWLALAALHGINNNAKKISIKQESNGAVSVIAEYKETILPSPGTHIASTVFEVIREITHIEGDKGKSKLALGIRDSSVDLEVSVKNKDQYKKMSLKFT